MTFRAALILPLLLTTPAVAGPHPHRIATCHAPHAATCVVDGDTIWLGGVKIRIENIDAPEISEPDCAAERRLGDEAKYRLTDLLNAGQLVVTRRGGRDEDRYGRKLRSIAVNGVDVGETLVREGLARVWPDGPELWCRRH